MHIDIGGGKEAEVIAPARPVDSWNLSDWVSYSFQLGVYKILEFMGGALGAFAAGVGVKFLERVEPSLVTYVRPLIDLLLDQEDLPEPLREFFGALREPEHEGGAAIIGGLASQAGGAVMGNVLSTMLAKVNYHLMRLMRPALLGTDELVRMYRRELLTREEVFYWLSLHGFEDEAIEAMLLLTQPRLSVQEVVRLYWREGIDSAEMRTRLEHYGYEGTEIAALLHTAEQYPGTRDLMTAHFRGELTRPQVRLKLQAQGFLIEDIHALMAIAKPLPGPTDLIRMGVREAWRDDIAARWDYDEDFPQPMADAMSLHGFDPEWATRFWRAHWTLPSVQMGYEMMHRDIIDPDELRMLLRVSDIPKYWREQLIKMSYRTLTRVDVRRMYGLGVLDRAGVKRSYLDQGYNEENAEAMTEFTVLYEAPDEYDLLGRYKTQVVNLVIDAFQKGMLDRAEATTQLMALDYEREESELRLELAAWQKEVATTPDFAADYEKDVRTIIERSYSRRLIGREEAVSMLGALGYGASESEYLLGSVDFWYNMEAQNAQLKTVGDAYVSRGINRTDVLTRLGAMDIPSGMQAQIIAEWDTARNLRGRRLTEAQYRRALTNNLISVNEYQENMRGLGYTEGDVWILTAMAAGSDQAGTKPVEGSLPPRERGV